MVETDASICDLSRDKTGHSLQQILFYSKLLFKFNITHFWMNSGLCSADVVTLDKSQSSNICLICNRHTPDRYKFTNTAPTEQRLKMIRNFVSKHMSLFVYLLCLLLVLYITLYVSQTNYSILLDTMPHNFFLLTVHIKL